jgi:HEPN domain-containing protein
LNSKSAESNEGQRKILEALADSIKKRFPDRPDISNNLESIIELLKTKRFPVTKEMQALALAFLETAETDRIDCGTLYRKKSYSNAAFHLQQAVEKATKAYWLGNGLLNEKEIRGHRTPEIFLRAIFEKTGLKMLAQQLRDKSTHEYIQKAFDAIENEERRLELAKIPFNNIRKSISYMESNRKLNEEMLRDLEYKLSSMPGYQLLSISLLSTIQSMSSLVTLYILAVYTFPHEAYSRYPDGLFKPLDYTKDLGIVRAIPDTLKFLKRAILELRVALAKSRQDDPVSQPQITST